MKVSTMVSGSIALFLLLSTMICGLWLRAGGAGSMNFHSTCGIASVVFSAITWVLLVFTLRNRKKGS